MQWVCILVNNKATRFIYLLDNSTPENSILKLDGFSTFQMNGFLGLCPEQQVLQHL